MQSQRTENKQSLANSLLICLLGLALLSGCQLPGDPGAFALQKLQNDRELIADSQRATSHASAAAYGIDQLGIDDGSSPTTTTAIQTAAVQTTAPENRSTPSYVPSPTAGRDATGDASQPQQNDGGGSFVYRAQSPQSPQQDSNVQPAAYQYPELQQQGAPGSYFSAAPPALNRQTIDVGAPNTPPLLVQPNAPSGVATFPQNLADLDVFLDETQTGRFNFGGAFNSDNGIVGQITIDERNFDIAAFPRSFQDLRDGTAWRGAGQSFRLELSPGANVERYLVSFGEPYLFNTPVSLNVSAYLFTRQYFDYNEERIGGRLALGYRLTPFISVSAGVRAENVEISDVRLPGAAPELDELVGDTDLFIGNVSLVRDTRDHPFLATTGSYLSLTFSQGFGEFDYSRGDLDFRKYRLIYQRPDGSGRHTLSLGTKLGVSGSQTPVFENYFAGGFSTLRGFDFRGASPSQNDVRVGGEFQWLNTLEYTFPLTADDMVRGVVFCDFGTVEESIEINSENFRVAPGFGFRVHMPAAGIGAPLAFDFAFPVASADTDEEQVFQFYLGALR